MTARSSRRLTLAVAVLALLPLWGATAAMQQAAKRPIQLEDIIAWKTASANVVSADGQWYGYRYAPQEGDAEVVIRRIHGDRKELRFPIGELPQPTDGGGGGRGAATGGGSSLAFSQDGRFVAFTTYPTRQAAQRLRRQRRPIQSSVTIVALASGEKHEYPRIRRFAFSGESSTWIALHRFGAEPGPGGGAPAAAASGRGGPAVGGAAVERPRGSDLILRELATGAEINVGNVGEFSFRRDGRLLAIAIDAQDKVGNGLEVRDMTTGVLSPLDSGGASYERISWSEKGEAVAVLKGLDDKAYRDKLYSVVGVTDVASASPHKVVFDPATDSSVPKGFSISPDREPQWTDDLQALFFGLREPRKKDAVTGADEIGDLPAVADAPAGDTAANADEKVDLVLWHYKDPRLQTQQEVQESRDR